jgi:hypothetical protein
MTEGTMRIVPGSSHPRCKGLCKGDRAAWESPAKFGHLPDGTKVVWCPCCEGQLRAEGPLDVQGRPPNLTPALSARHRRFIDDSCGYDVVVLKNLVPS